VLITHDRHLIRNVSNHTVEVVHGRVTEYAGDYDYYLSKKEPEPEVAAPSASPPRATASGPKSKERKRIEAEARARTKSLRDRVSRIEGRLETLTHELAEMEAAFADPEFYATSDDVAALTKRYEAGKRRRVRLEAEWAEAVERLELSEAQ